jgi:TPP-dependent pyruvate/acetoin dehydrogenase alpha subunit
LPTEANTNTALDPSVVEPAGEYPGVPRDTRLALFRLVLLQRVIEERIITLYRQGRIPGSVYTGRGQEAVAAGAGLALGPDDVVAPLNRELACHLARGVEVAHVFRQYLGRGTGPTQGRDGNMHFGVRERNIFPLVSMLGDLCPLTVGAALAFKRRGEPRVAMTFWGDGAMSTGDVHEGLNLAAVLHVPAVFVVQNNQFAYSTPTARQMANTNISERIRGGWGIPCERVDGTDALAVYEVVGAAVERARAGEGPQAIEALSLRMEGHAAHDDGRYMDQAVKEEFRTRRDPVERLAARLLLDGLGEEEVRALRESAVREVAEGLAEAETAPPPDPATLLQGVYATPL